MTQADKIVLFHSPHSRSTGVLTLLEELHLPYELQLVNMKAGEQRKPAYFSINPMGKVPAIHHRGQLVTEQVAIFIYLADLAEKSGMAPMMNDPMRGAYLRWLVFYAACYEPAIVDKSMKREPAPLATSPYGSFDDMWSTLTGQLSSGRYLLGDRFSAADMLWGISLQWGGMFGLLPEHDAIKRYVADVTSRPVFAKVAEWDMKWAAKHAELAKIQAA
jgi:glutathione S-transferase